MASSKRARRRRAALLELVLLMATVPATIYSASPRNDSPDDHRQQDFGSIDAFNSELCGRAKFRAWQEEQSAFGCTGGMKQRGASESRGHVLAPRIIDGTFAHEDEFPSFVHLNYTISGRTGPHCGATLIHDNLVVTAAHCVVPPPINAIRPIFSNMSLIFGSNRLDGAGGKVRQVARWCYPSSYNETTGDYDLAIIRFEESIGYTSKIAPACLRLDSLPAPNAAICAFAGLGSTVNGNEENVVLPEHLKTFRVKSSCETQSEVQTCYETIGTGGGVTANGDSGSPIMCYDRCGPDESRGGRAQRARAFVVGALRASSHDDLANDVTDFHKLRIDFLALLRDIQNDGNTTTSGVKCEVPAWVDTRSMQTEQQLQLELD